MSVDSYLLIWIFCVYFSWKNSSLTYILTVMFVVSLPYLSSKPCDGVSAMKYLTCAKIPSVMNHSYHQSLTENGYDYCFSLSPQAN